MTENLYFLGSGENTHLILGILMDGDEYQTVEKWDEFIAVL